MDADKFGEETRQGLQRVETKIDLLSEEIKSLTLQIIALEAALNAQPIDDHPSRGNAIFFRKAYAFLTALFRDFRRRHNRLR
ncbi:hypothetical protein [Asaia bogorensis]|nr:hypothetical protein [Asaia bogorensis]